MPSRLLSSVLPMMSFVWIKTDFNLMGEQGIDFGVLPIMMYFITIGFVLILTLSSFLTGKTTIMFFVSNSDAKDSNSNWAGLQAGFPM